MEIGREKVSYKVVLKEKLSLIRGCITMTWKYEGKGFTQSGLKNKQLFLIMDSTVSS